MLCTVHQQCYAALLWLWVQVQAASGDPWILEGGTVWQLLSTAIAAAAEGNQSAAGLLPRLLEAVQPLSNR